MTDGRPLRFLVLVMVGWVGVRALMLWPSASITMSSAPAGKPIASSAKVTEIRLPVVAAAATPPSSGRGVAVFSALYPLIVQDARHSAFLAYRPLPAAESAPATAPTTGQRPPGLVAGLPAPLEKSANSRSRLFGSFWLFARGGNGLVGAVPGVQLGGSQAGVRLAYALTEDRRLAIAARAASPIGRGMRELAIGVEWQPTRLPVRIVAEQRFALNEGRGGPSLSVVGGAGPLPLVAGFDLEGYGQAGIIGRGKGEAFVDGAMRVARPVARLGGVQLDLGAGAWGAAQKGASRFDIGPSVSARLPIGKQPVRLSLDWRQRIAGNATPDSGPVLTLGADF